jgi:hypothetical protein
LAALLEHRVPGVLGVLQDDTDELRLRVAARRLADRPFLHRRGLLRDDLLDEAQQAQQLPRSAPVRSEMPRTTRRPMQPKPPVRPPGTRMPRRSSTLLLPSRPSQRMQPSGPNFA